MTGRRRAGGRAPHPRGQIGFWIVVGVLLLIALSILGVPILVFM